MADGIHVVKSAAPWHLVCRAAPQSLWRDRGGAGLNRIEQFLDRGGFPDQAEVRLVVDAATV
ncbi:MAG: hypothetical protein K9G48_15265, partial [Reyranella sp.]|nr:hypothetical protein [Reyranella sp.]